MAGQLGKVADLLVAMEDEFERVKSVLQPAEWI